MKITIFHKNYNNNIVPVKISPFSALFYSTAPVDSSILQQSDSDEEHSNASSPTIINVGDIDTISVKTYLDTNAVDDQKDNDDDDNNNNNNNIQPKKFQDETIEIFFGPATAKKKVDFRASRGPPPPLDPEAPGWISPWDFCTLQP